MRSRTTRAQGQGWPKGRVRHERHERGAALVEAAIVIPLLLMFVFGVVDFGAIYSNRTAVNQGVRDSARQGVVANFGTNSGCPTTGSAATGNTQKLICLTKERVGLNSTKTRVRVVAPATYAVGQQVLVCAEYPIDPITPLTGQFITVDAIRSKAVMRLEQTSTTGLTTAGETAITNDWSWCV